MNASESWPMAESLAPELEPYLSEPKDGWQVLQHPLVYQVPYFPPMNAVVNRILRNKREQLLIAREGRNWQRYLMLHERPYRLNAFTVIESLLTDTHYWELLGDLWQDSENIWQNFPVWTSKMKSLRPERHNFMSKEDKERLDAMPKRLTIYRGGSARNRHGLSYSLDYDKALWFSRRLDCKDPMVYKRTVRKVDVFALLLSRDEQEVIIHPDIIKAGGGLNERASRFVSDGRGAVASG